MVFQLHLDTETVEHIDLPTPFCVTPDVSVREVLERMKEERRGSALICRDEKLVGIFTERDSLQLMAKNGSIEKGPNRRQWRERKKQVSAKLDAQTPPGYGRSG